MMGLQSYRSLKYPTPEDLRGNNQGDSVLVIGSGPSTSELIKYKSLLRDRFDLIVGVNRTIRDFEDVLDYHVVLEKKPLSIVSDMNERGYRKDLPRVLNYKAIQYFPDDVKVIKARREYFHGDFSLRHYKRKGLEGLLENWDKAERNFGFGSAIYSGTVTMQAVHFACILGCTDVYLIGAELMFDGYYDHYYKDRHYRDKLTPVIRRSKLMEVKIHDGRMVTTNSSFYRSAKFFNHVIANHSNKFGIRFFDFSNGLIRKAKKLSLEDYFENKNDAQGEV